MLLRLCRVALAVIAISVLYWISSNGAGYYLRSPWEMFAMSCYALEAAALAASPGPRRGLRLLLTWRRGLALAVAAATTGILWKLTYGVYLSSGPAAQRAAALIVLGSIAIAMVMSSRLGRHLVVLFAIMFYPVALALARETAYVPLPVAMTRSWLALMYLPPLLLAAMAVAGSRRSREGIRPAASLDAPARPGYPDVCPGAGTAASVRASTSRRRNRGTGRHGRTDDWFRPVWCSMPVPLPPGTAFRLMDAG